MPRRHASCRHATRATALKMNVEMLARLNEYHSRVVFPNRFDRDITFADVSEVQYHFHVDKASDVIYLSKTVCFFASAGSLSSKVTIKFQRTEGALMGEWIAQVVDVKDLKKKKSGKGILGFTANAGKLDDSYESMTTDVPDRAVVGMGPGAA